MNYPPAVQKRLPEGAYAGQDRRGYWYYRLSNDIGYTYFSPAIKTSLPKDHTYVIDLYLAGVLGSPTKQKRGSSCRCVFWDVYNGLRDATHYRGSLSAHYAKAAQVIKQQGLLPTKKEV